MKALDLAAYIVNLCIEKGNPVSNLQLQKIMYFTHLYYLRNYKSKLITDLPFEAWKFGPVIEQVYYKYSICNTNTSLFPLFEYVRYCIIERIFFVLYLKHI